MLYCHFCDEVERIGRTIGYHPRRAEIMTQLNGLGDAYYNVTRLRREAQEETECLFNGMQPIRYLLWEIRSWLQGKSHAGWVHKFERMNDDFEFNLTNGGQRDTEREAEQVCADVGSADRKDI
jgi:hypothetical protein